MTPDPFSVKPEVSIVVAVYNARPYLAAGGGKSFGADFFLILRRFFVDDGSTDGRQGVSG